MGAACGRLNGLAAVILEGVVREAVQHDRVPRLQRVERGVLEHGAVDAQSPGRGELAAVGEGRRQLCEPRVGGVIVLNGTHLDDSSIIVDKYAC